MKLTIESTQTITTISGVAARLWLGTHEDGTKVKMFMVGCAVDQHTPSGPFDRELLAMRAPTESVPLSELAPAAPQT